MKLNSRQAREAIANREAFTSHTGSLRGVTWIRPAVRYSVTTSEVTA
jgi:hypothetical protein